MNFMKFNTKNETVGVKYPELSLQATKFQLNFSCQQKQLKYLNQFPCIFILQTYYFEEY